MQVLIADDSAIVRAQLSDTLAEAGYDVVTTADGQQAWEALCTHRYQIAILDWLMPGLKGPEICRKLQQRQDLKSIYVVILTAKSGTENVAEALASGANDYIVKPFDKGELLARLGAAKRIVQLQMDLADANRLASLGELAAGIAHEINTPMQYVGDNVQFLREGFLTLRQLVTQYGRFHEAAASGKVNDDLIATVETARREADIGYLMDEIPAAVDQSLEGIGHVTTIVKAMKSFCHPGTRDKVATNLNEAIETTITISRNEWKYAADLTTDFDPDLPQVFCVAGDFNRVILNLIVNASHAIADVADDRPVGKGTIAICTRQDGPWVEIRVSDTGTGIPVKIQKTIFDSFFTTKEAGKGTGQGLAIARNVVVDQHGGTIDFETEVGKGTTFIVRLPVNSEMINEGADRNEEKHSVC